MKYIYKYHGGVEVMEGGPFNMEIVLGDIDDWEHIAPIRLSVGGGLAKYIYLLEGTDDEERYLKADYYFDRNLYLRRIEIPAADPNAPRPAKIIAQVNPWDEEVYVFGETETIKTRKPEPMSAAAFNDWFTWKVEHAGDCL